MKLALTAISVIVIVLAFAALNANRKSPTPNEPAILAAVLTIIAATTTILNQT